MNQTRPTLLVVDDEPEVLRSVHDLLRLDYQVMTCRRGADALKVLESAEEIHVVMSDQRMPEMSGVELLHHARQLRPDATRLLFTAYADIRAVVDAINEGNIFRYIAKPWDPLELESVIRQAVDQHNLIVEKARLVEQLQESNRQLVEANRLKAAFIEVASHELNTPVAVVLGMTELWKMSQAKDATPAEKSWVERIQGAGKRLAGTVERMLKLIRSGQFGHTLSLEPTVLEPLVREVVAGLKPYLDARGQTIALNLHPELGIAQVDAAKFADILTNLLINAIKFTPDGGTLRIAAGPHGPDQVRFEVADPGVGIGETDWPHLFEPFFTGFDTMHHSSGDYQFCKRGMGLGLCLVKTFVELHGGTIEVASSLGAGSTFAFIIPRGVTAELVTPAPL
ncbi:hybrid sensor histidine kinase/response regulator [Singulisphaera acidiphila]|uniref:histidine kinase n=1 Tax=Singulisphaera acidiphila (strain ATCC BAA-1392 / DSM 18658 / VKM B-2454 / MOB10) TaxID=886293 RepID=L0DMV6_SINAD|nr:hybrid sensor histidine kinase/response regulator [Singulisphaera acidiphila]AGA30714.1 histidine kinase,Response regulator receiver domain protein,histidine kinase [Singulisphaera acidiphila DSM 18658]